MKYAFFYTSLLIFIAVSCQEEPILRFGFDTEFDKNSQGLTIMSVGNTKESIVLFGEIMLSEGEISVELTDPLGENLFKCHLKSPVYFNVNELFETVPGYWILKYKSFGGIGSIVLHMNIE
jgi:hypothetical protein